MKHIESQFQAYDGLQLYVQRWEPQDKPCAIVCLVHGLGEHSSRYGHVARFLTDAGYLVNTFDLRGHGKSGGARGHAPSFEAFMFDIDQLLADAQQRFPDLPCFLYGHSLGGVLALAYTLQRRPKLNGVIATSPGLRTTLEQQKIKVAIAKSIGALLPTLTLNSGLDAALISHDPQVVQTYLQDPLVHDLATAAMAKNTLNVLPWIFEHAGEFPVPLLLLHGSADQIALVSGSQDFARLYQGDCTLRVWDGLYHELHNELQQGEVFQYLLEWMEKRQ